MRSELPFIPGEPGWPVTTLGALCERGSGDIQTGPFGSQLHADDYVDNGIPSIMPQDIVAGRIDLSAIARIAEADAERLSRYRVRTGDIVYSRRGDIRRRVLIRPAHDGWRTGCLRVRLGDSADPRWVTAYLGHPAVQGWIERNAVGATMLNLNTEILGRVPLALPDREEQGRIAAVLGTLDDKIDGSRRLSGLLLASLSAVFRHRLSETSRDAWEAADLTAIARFVNGRALTKHANERGRPILRIKELNDGVTDATPLSDIDAQDDNIARHHDILFSWSGSLDLYRWHGPESLINQHIFKVLPKDGLPPWFVVGWIREHLSEFQAIARDKATTMGHIKREHLKTAAVSIPPRELLSELDGTLSPLDEHVAILATETRTLEQLRDTLLPKLISGEIRVPDTSDPEEVIGPAAEATATSAA